MKMKLICCLFLIMTTVANAAHYSSQWAVHIEGGPQVANSIAAKHGFVNLGEIFPDMYHFEHRSISKRSADPSIEPHENLLKESEVKWAKQQKVKSRKKRDLLPLPRSRSHYRVSLNDPRWQQMWYLNRGEGLDMNVQPAWQEGVIGRGVVVTILDDGLEKDHPDLFRNYDPQASYDVNNHDEDPMPRYDLIDSNRHGTRCAGEVAAAANNTLCAVGVAYGASVGGVRMLDGDVTDAVEARSLSLNPQHIDIYSASWGPDDDGKTVDGPGELATRAFMEGVNKGRSGKGSIFVWASGNGGRDHDNCNCDGYTNSIWTLSISSATENGHVPWYSEACSSTLATTYSSGASGEKQVVTTDLHHQCTSSHTGTSASAPLAAGICALALEANRELTWRDMQHIVVRTARPANLKSVDWKVNGVGRNVSHSFGYGLMDASAMVRLARKWKTVPEQRQCEVSAPHVDKPIPAKSHVTLELHVKECAGVNYLEHVQAKISLASSRRGDLQIHLTSPTGTRSTLLARRPHDVSRSGFQDWPFMSVHTWGEKPFGKWQLEIHNEGRFLGRATLQKWAIIFYGTTVTPDGNEGPSPPVPPFRGSPGSSSLPSRPSRPIPGPKSPPFVISVSPQHKSKNLSSGRQKNNQKLTIKQTPPRAPPTVPSRLSVIETRQHIVPTANRPRLKNSTISTIATRLTTKKPKVLPTSRIPYTLSNITNSTQTAFSSLNGSIANVSTIFTTTISKTTTTMKTTSTTATTSTSTTTPGSDLTILLEPPSHTPPKVPEIFQHYPKFQQLIPLYPLTKLDGLGGGNKGRVDSSSFRPSANLVPNKLEFVQEETRHQTAGAGSLSQWKLVFYGTETAPDGDLFDSEDDSRKVSVNLGTNSLGARPGMPDIRDNEEDPQQNLVLPVPGGGQWKSVPDHSRNEIPRTTTEDDKVSSSASTCLALSKKGQQCIECIDGLYLYGGHCVSKCPDNYFPGVNEKSQPECMWCHYTCKTCLGPNDYQCATCYDDASLQQMSKTERYCYPKSLLPAIETEKWFYWMFVAFSVNGILLILIICYFVIFKIMKKSNTHQYTKINRAEDAVQFTKNLDRVKNVVYELSDSDSN